MNLFFCYENENHYQLLEPNKWILKILFKKDILNNIDNENIKDHYNNSIKNNASPKFIYIIEIINNNINNSIKCNINNMMIKILWIKIILLNKI